jgi:hypothetical protein
MPVTGGCQNHKAHVITALPGLGRPGASRRRKPCSGESRWWWSGYDRDGLAADDQPEPVLGYDGNGLACVNHADLDYRLRP